MVSLITLTKEKLVPMTKSCSVIWDVLKFLEEEVRMELPGSLTAEDLLDSKAGFIVWYAEKVTEDSGFWRKVPRKLPVAFRTGKIATKVQLRAYLMEQLEDDE